MNGEKTEGKKKRYSVTLSDSFQKGLNEAIKQGMYLDIQSAIRSYIKYGFEKDEIYPFKKDETEKEGKMTRHYVIGQDQVSL